MGAGDTALYGWCGAGIAASVLLMLGFAPLPCLIFLWVDYLSLMRRGTDLLPVSMGYFAARGGISWDLSFSSEFAFGEGWKSPASRAVPVDLAALSFGLRLGCREAFEWRPGVDERDGARLSLLHATPADAGRMVRPAVAGLVAGDECARDVLCRTCVFRFFSLPPGVRGSSRRAVSLRFKF